MREEIRKACALYFIEPKIELFGRKEVDGWIVLGNEIDARDIREALEEMVC